MRRGLARAALVAWTARVAYLPVELLVAAGAVGGYSLRDDTVSDLGILTCREDGVCSPHHAVMNGAFGVAGVLLAAGALLAHRHWTPGVRARVATGALVVTGVASLAVGLAPIDQSPTLHYAVAAPIFVAQPIGLLLLATLVRPGRVRGVLVAAGGAAVVGAVVFVVLGEGASWRGAWERLALWPAFVAYPLVLLARRQRGDAPAGSSGA